MRARMSTVLHVGVVVLPNGTYRARCICGWYTTDPDMFSAMMLMEFHQEVCGSDGR